MAKQLKHKSNKAETAPQNKWEHPHEIDDVTAAFPATVTGTLLPAIADIPESFRDFDNAWCDFVEKLFFKGGALPLAKQGIDSRKARRHLMTVLRSFEPKHEDKIFGAAWLMSLWYESPAG